MNAHMNDAGGNTIGNDAGGNTISNDAGGNTIGYSLLLWGAMVLWSPALEAADCTRIIRQNGNEIIHNKCDVCMKVRVLRERHGYARPTYRDHIIQGRMKFPLSHVGKGRARIQTEMPCGGERGSNPHVTDARRQCIKATQTAQGYQLYNDCDHCRQVIIERHYHGGEKVRKVYKDYNIAAGDRVPLNAEGADRAGLIHEKNCPER